MPVGSDPWAAQAAIADCPTGPWRGHVWRCHARRYPGDNAGGSLKFTGRYNRGRDAFPSDAVWPALYTGLAEHIALGERIRHTKPEVLEQLALQRISHLRVDLQIVLDACDPDGCVEPAIQGLSGDDLCRPADYRVTHALAQSVRDRGAEGFLIPSCTRFRGGNLIIFPDLLHRGSVIDVVETEDPDLYVDWARIASGE